MPRPILSALTAACCVQSLRLQEESIKKNKEELLPWYDNSAKLAVMDDMFPQAKGDAIGQDGIVINDNKL
jgi:hypothetical protein